jgi:hypothetical protein
MRAEAGHFVLEDCVKPYSKSQNDGVQDRCKGKARQCCCSPETEQSLSAHTRESLPDREFTSFSAAQVDTSVTRARKLPPNEALRCKRLQLLWPLAPTLQLHLLPSNTTIKVNALGAELSLRGEKDGRTYFGCKKRGNTDKSILNDVVIRVADSDTSERHRGRHFVVEYDPFREAYFARDLGCGFGLFARLDSQMRIRENAMLQVGLTCLVISVIPMKSVDSAPKLRIKVTGGLNTGQIFLFSTTDRVRLGRHPQCEVALEDSLLSKVQCSLHWEDCWWLWDGDRDRPSKNGTWVYTSEDWEVRTGTVLRAGSWVLEAEICS